MMYGCTCVYLKLYLFPLQSISGMCIGVTADFHRLNILLVHLEDSVSGRNARKVATITMSNAQINARISE